MQTVVRIVSVLLTCEACDATAHLTLHHDAWQRHTQPGGAFIASHLRPRLTHVELVADGRPAVWRQVVT